MGRNNEYCWYAIIMGWIRGCCGDNAIHRPVVAGTPWRTCYVDGNKRQDGQSLWLTLALFNAAFWWYLAETQGREVADPQALAFLTGYLIEKSLAVDNVFVWLMLFASSPSSRLCSAGCWCMGFLARRVAYYHDFSPVLAYHSVRMAALCVPVPSCCLPA